MRKIESQMLEAVQNGKTWSKDSTTVYPIVGGMEVALHGHPIAKIDEYGQVNVDLYTLRNWPTNTTKSRLRSLGVNVKTVKGDVMVNGEKI